MAVFPILILGIVSIICGVLYTGVLRLGLRWLGRHLCFDFLRTGGGVRHVLRPMPATVMERVLDISSCRASNDRDFGRQQSSGSPY